MSKRSVADETRINLYVKSLKTVAWRIKYNGDWYELRLRHNSLDPLFEDQDGALFGLPDVQINFCVFKTGSLEIPDWARQVLKEFFGKMQGNYPDPKDLYSEGFVTYDGGFVQYLLAKGGFAVFSSDGKKQKKWEDGEVF